MRTIVASIVGAVLLVSPLAARAQQGTVSLDAVARAMGAAGVRSLEITGTGTVYAVGQSTAPGAPWPRFTMRTSTRTINYETGALRDGNLGRLLGFDVYTSENMPEVTKAACLAWYKPSYAFVSQIAETEALRANDRFADRLRGLHVYGGKAVRSTGIVRWIDQWTDYMRRSDPERVLAAIREHLDASPDSALPLAAAQR